MRSQIPNEGARSAGRGFTRFVLFSLVLVLFAVPLFAQTAARVEGRVQDPTGAVVPNATITLLNLSTQQQYQVISSDQGQFVVPVVVAGKYKMTVEAKGFQKHVTNNMEINVGAIMNPVVKLAVGQASESVVVEANAVTVQTTDSQNARSITMKDIDTLPQLARTPILLAAFQPGVQLNPGDVTFSRVNGQRGGSNNSKLDGIDVNDSLVPRLGLSLTANNTDSIAEFKMVTSGGKAEYGRNAGGQVELISRSGSNKFHGGAYDYLRNTVLNANDYFNKVSGSARPKLIQNQFGGQFGGPIMKDKAFIFGNVQRRKTIQETVRNRTVLTAAAKSGLFTYLNQGVNKTYNILANDPRALGIPAMIAANLAMLPASNNCDLGDGLNTCGFRFNNSTGSFEDQFTIKGDYKFTKTHSAFLRWSWQRNLAIDALNGADATFPGQAQGSQGGKRWGYSIGDDWNFGSSWVNEFRFGHQSATVAFNRPGRVAGPMIISNLFTDPLNTAFPQGRNSPVNDITDNMTKVKGNHIFKFGVNMRMTLQTGYNDGGIYPNINLTTGSGNSPTPPNLPVGLNALTATQRTTLNNLYNDLLGRISTIPVTYLSANLTTFLPLGSTRQRDYTLNESGYYIQDDWKIRRNLTLNLGLRWELFGQAKEKNKIQATLAEAPLINGINLLTNTSVVRTGSFYKTDWNNFAPRIGFAWDIFGDGKTSLRGNYGVFYDRAIGAIVNTADGNTPGFSTSLTSTPQTVAPPAGAPAGDVRVSDVPLGIPAQPAAPITLVPVGNRGTSVVLFDPNLRTGYVQNWGLSVQREIMRNTVIDVGYVGNRGIKLYNDLNANQLKTDGVFLNAFKELQAFNASGTPTSANNPLVLMFTGVAASVCNPANVLENTPTKCAVNKIGSTNLVNGNVGTAAGTIDASFNAQYVNAGLPQTFLRSYPQYNLVVLGTNSGASTYDSLQIGFRRNAGSLRTNANYNYSHSIDNLTGGDGNGYTSPQDGFNPARIRGNGDADHRHSFNASVSYALPIGKGQRFGSNLPRWADEIIGGWEVGSLIAVQDGAVFTVSSTRTTFANANTFADFTGDKHIGSIVKNADGSVFFLTAADFAKFSFPVAGTLGTSGRNAFRGPRFVNVDSSLVKKFKITESTAITFRAEAYNLFNHANFGGMSTSMTSPATFGKMSSTLGAQGTGARTMQLALRFDF